MTEENLGKHRRKTGKVIQLNENTDVQKCNLIQSKFSPRPSHGTIKLAVLVKGVCENTGVRTDTHHRTQ